MQVVIFEDEHTRRLTPLVDLKPVYGLVSGCRSLQERFSLAFDGKARLSWHMREALAPWFLEQHPEHLVNAVSEDDLLLVNGRLVCDDAVVRSILGNEPPSGRALLQDGELLFCRTTSDVFRAAGSGQAGLIDTAALAGVLQCGELNGFRLVRNIWDPVALHPELMQEDSSSMDFGTIDGQVHPAAVLVNPQQIFIGRGAVVMAGAVVDASEGFVHIGEGAVVEPQALLMQNVFIDRGARVKSGARIYSNVHIGSSSKAGGEIEDSIMEAFSNKQHDGFLGHSYISHWCNLGAATNTSDLKNNYGKVSIEVEGRRVPTGQQFLGLLMGEHSKCAIGTMFTTGTLVGTSANIFGAGTPARHVPSFSWGNGANGFEASLTDKVVETARVVMGRRRVVMTPAYEALFRSVAANGPGRFSNQ